MKPSGPTTLLSLLGLLSLLCLLTTPQAALAQVSLTASDVTETTATLTIANHTGAWYYKGNQSGATCISVDANTTSADLASLTGGTAYTYKAYSNNTCTTELTSATSDADFTTLGLSAGTPAQTTATLTLSNWTATWWHKKTAGPGTATCASVGANTGTADLAGLTVASSYTWEVYKAANCGAADKIADVSFTTLPITLAASNLDQTTATITLAGHAAAWYYKGNQSGATCTSVVAGLLEINLTGLTPSTAYTYKAYSDSSCATELTTATSDAEFTTLAAAVPATMAKPSVSGGNARVRVSWIAPDSNGAAITGYQYQQKTGTGQWGSWTTIAGSANATSHIITTLTNGTSYQFKLRAVNSVGNGGESPASNPVSPASRTLSVSDTGATTATLTLSSPAEDWYYKYTAPATPAGTCSSPQSGARASATGLVPAASHTIKAYGDSGCSFELAAASAFLTKPGQVQDVAATAGLGQLDLSWTAHSGTVTGYKVQWKSGNESYNTSSRQTTVSGATSNSGTISNLTGGTEYTVRVTAYNASGDGAASAEVKATPLSKTLTAGKITQTGATLTLANHSGNWYYKYTAPATPAGVCSGVQSAASVKVAELSAGTSYTYKAYSDSTCSTEIATAPAFSTLAAAPPAAPAKPTVSGGNTAVALSWTAPDDGGAAITRYEYVKKAGTNDFEATWTQIANSANLTAHRVTGLTNGTDYKFKVRAVNSAGDGAESPESDTVTPAATVPAAPGAPGVRLGNQQVTLSWTAPDTGGAAITRYEYIKKVGTADFETNWTQIPSSANLTSFAVTGLTNATAYRFKLRAVNSVGDGAASPQSEEATPSASATFYATNVQSNSATLVMANHATDWWYKAINPTPGPCTKVDAGTSTIDLASISSDTDFLYRGYSDSNCTTALGGASGATFTTRPTQVIISVTPGSTGGSLVLRSFVLAGTGYKVQWKQAGQDYNTGDRQKIFAGITNSNPTITGLTPGAQYTVRMAAYNATGDGPWSAEKTGTPGNTKPAAPAKPGVTAGDTEVLLTWTAPDNGGRAITRYEYVKKVGAADFETNWTQIPSSANLTSHIVTGLTNATAHRFKVRAVNSVGNSDASPQSDAATPAASTLTSSAVGSATATLTIGNHVGDWHYKYTTPSGGQCSAVQTTAAATATKLLGNTSYTFAAYGDATCSTLLATATAFTTSAATTPSAPAKPGVRAGDTEALLTWTAPGDGGSAITGYKYQQKTGGTWGAWTAVPNSGATTTSYTATGLTNSTAYKFKVRAVNTNGDGAESPESDTVTPGSPSLASSAVGRNTATLTITNHVGDWWYKYTAPATPAGACSGTAVTGAAASLTQLLAGTAYTFAAYSDATCATLLATAAAFTTTAATTPGKPGTPSATAGNAQATLTWTAPADNGGSPITRYEYIKKVGTAAFETAWTQIPDSASLTSHTVTGLTNATAHQFKLRAVNSAGNGAESDASASVTPFDGNTRITLGSLAPSRVPEGGSATYTLVLASAPTANVTIAIANRGLSLDDASLTTNPATLSFTSSNWNTKQTVTVSAAQDLDAADGRTVLTHTATSSDTTYNNIVANLTVSEDDDDSIGLMLSKTTLDVPEGGSATYTLRANTLPTHDITLNFATASTSDGDITLDANPVRAGNQSSMVITTKGWDLPRTITLRAAEDNDTAAGTATINHTAVSSDPNYNGVAIPNVVATEVDNDSGLVISAGALEVAEGSTATYTVKLSTAPSADVTVTLGSESGGDADLTFSPASLTFTSSNWSTAQTVTVTAAQDVDSTAGTKIVTHTASSADSAYSNLPVAKVALRETDDEATGILLSTDVETVTEGASVTYTVKLTKAPTSDVTVTVANRSGAQDDTDITVSPASLTFTSSTWNTAQTVTLSAAEDADKTDGIAVITHTASGGGFDGVSASITINENDNDSTNASPTSRNFSYGVSRDRRSSIALTNFPFSDADAADTLGRIKIVTLPNAADGTLGTVLTGIRAAAVTGCVGDIQPIDAGAEIVNELRKVLYFCPKTGFSSTSFQFKVIDSRGQQSGVNYTATLIGPPGQVTGLKATGGNAHVALSWTNPKNTSITGYEYRQKTVGGYGAWTAIGGAGASTTSHSVASLTNATAYTFQVRAKTLGGAGLASAGATATPASAVPAKPTNFRAVEGRSGIDLGGGLNGVEAHLFWDNPSDPSITFWAAEANPTNLGVGWLPADSRWRGAGVPEPKNRIPNSDANTTSVVVHPVGQQNPEVKLRVRAVNAAGNGPWSDEIELEMNYNPEPLLAPATPGNGRVRLDWQYFGGAETQSKCADSNPPGCWGVNVNLDELSQYLNPSPKSLRSHTVTGLTNGNTYSYYVRTTIANADSYSGGAASNTVSVTLPGPPAKPASLTATASTTGATLSWTRVNNTAVTGYEYRQKNGNNAYGAWTRVPRSDANTTSYAVDRLTSGVTYKFQVRAVIEYSTALGGNLNGVNSDEASVTPFGLVLSPTTLAVPEGGSATYNAKLTKAPTANVTVTPAINGDPNLTLSPSTLTFTISNWQVAQTVTVSAAEDSDELHGNATVEHSLASTDTTYANALRPPQVTVSEADNDITVQLSATTLDVTEGSTATYTVGLSQPPLGSVTVTITSTGDTDLTADTDTGTTGNQNSITLTPTSHSGKLVTLAAAEDNDSTAGTATFTHTLSGGAYSGVAAPTLVATEADNEAVMLSGKATSGSTGTLSITNHTAAWWYKKTSPTPAGTCTSVTANTASASLTSLSEETSYTYKAYSAANCPTANELATATFSTPVLGVTGVKDDAATLTLAHYPDQSTGGWYYKKTAPTPAGTCTSVSAGTTRVALASLTEKTSHTFEAWKNATCSGSGNKLASETFSTLGLDATAITQTGATLTLANRTGAWWYKGNQSSATCTPIASGAATLANLTGNTAYTYKAYSADGCNAANELASESLSTLSTVGLTVSDITQTTATLTLSNRTGAWWYKGNQSGATCTAVADGTYTASLASLTANTSYTYKAYSANTCATGVEISGASATFSTLSGVSLTVSAVTHNTATLSIANFAGSVWYYKGDWSGAACTPINHGSTANATGLPSASAVVFKAYSDGACSSGKVLATAASATTKPGQVTGLALTVKNSALEVGWTAQTGTVTGYKVQWKSGTQDYNTGNRQRTVTSGTATTILGLTNDTAYTFRVTAYNATGDGPASAESSATPLSTAPSPATLTASSVEATSATLTLTQFTGNWWLQRTTPADTTCKSKGTTATESLASLSSNTNYSYTAYSDSSCSTVLATEESFLTKPGKATGLTVARVGSGKLALSASVTGGGTLSRWQYQQKEGNNNYGSWTNIVSTSTTLNHTLTSLTDTTSYQFKVRAVNATGDGAASDASDAITAEAPELAASGINDTGATLTLSYWSPAWWYKDVSPGTGSCTSVAAGTSTASVTWQSVFNDLRYSAYSDSTCSTQIQEVQFTTISMDPAQAFYDEGLNGSIRVILNTALGGSENVTVTLTNPDTGAITLGSDTCTFTPGGVRTCNVSITTVQDADYGDEAITVTGSASGGGGLYSGSTGNALVNVRDDDGILTSASTVALTEGGGTGTFTARLAGAPNADVTMTTTSLDTGAVTASPASLTFTSTNWSTAQTITLTPVDDQDGNHESVTIRLAASGGGYGTFEDVTATVIDDEGPTLTASGVTHNAATLTLTNHSGNWWLRRSVPADTTCKSKGSTATESLSNLSGNSSYTYKAYSNNTCTTELTRASSDADFLTTPGKPTKPAAASGGGSGKLTLTSSVTGQGVLTGWEYQQKEGANNYGSWIDIDSTDKSLSFTVSSLTDGNDYKFKVRAKNATGDGAVSDESDTASPVNRTLTASSLTHNAATLTIGGYSGNWYYKANATPDNTCKGPVSGLTKGLTGLSSNTSYTYKAYSDSTCTDANLLATASPFLTKPGKADRPTAATNVGSGKLTITSSVSDSGTLAKWQYQQKASSDSDFGAWQNITSTSTTLNHTVSSLTNGTSYQFKVRAVNTTGNGAISDASTAKTPAAPTLESSSVEAATATLSIGKYDLAWYYKADAAPDNNCSSEVSAGTKTKNLTGLSGNTSYTYTAYADSGCSTSLVSASAFLTEPGTPDKPTVATNVGSGKLTISSSVSGSGTLTGWQYQSKKDSNNYGSWQDISSTSTDLSHTVSGLTNGSSYKFKVRAKNATGTGAASAESDAGTPAARTLTASSVQATSATISIAGHATAWYYKANAAPDNTCQGPVNAGTSEKDLTGLSPNTSYTYEAYSDSTCTTANKLATAAFLTKPSKASTPALTTNLGTGRLEITASVTDSGTLKKWQYSFRTGGSHGAWKDISSTSTSLSYTVTGLTNATDHRFKVRAVNDTGNGAASDESSAAQPAQPSLSASSVEATTATLTIANFTPGWYYKYTSPGGGTCSSSAVTGLTKDLTDLSSNTNYTFKAYSDSACSELQGTASFLTKPGAPGKPNVTTNLGSDRLRLSASVGGDGAISRWEYQQKEGNGNFSAWAEIDVTSDSTSLRHEVTGLNPNTQYQFKLRVTNSAGTGAASEASDAQSPRDPPDDNRTPSFAPDAAIAPQTYTRGTPIPPLTLPEASGGDGTLSYSLTPAPPAGLTFDTATRTLSGTPSEASAAATYTYTVTDSDGDRDGLAFSITVIDDLVPTFAPDTGIADQTYLQNAAIPPLVLPEATGGDGTLSYSLTPAPPAGLIFDAATRTLSGTPSEASAATTYSFTARDADVVNPDSASLIFSIDVIADLAPSFGDAAIADQAYQQTIPIKSLQLPQAMGGDGDLTYRLTPALPAGLVFDAAARTLSGTPEVASAAATYSFTVTDSDATGADSATLTFTLAVDPDSAPDFAGVRIDDLRLTRGQALDLPVLPEAQGGNGAIIYSLSPELPPGLAFDAATRLLSGIPTEPAAARTYEYTATDSDPLEPDAAVLTFSIEVSRPEGEKQVLNDALAAQGRALLSSATGVIGKRFRAPPAVSAQSDAGDGERSEAALNALAGWLASQGGGGVSAGGGAAFEQSNGFGQTQAFGEGGVFQPGGAFGNTGTSLSNAPIARDANAPHGQPGAGPRATIGQKPDWNLGQLIWGRAFAVALPTRGGDGEASDVAPRWTLWGAADAQRFDATAGAGMFDGGTRSLYLGADARFGGGNWLAGAALSQSAGDADYNLDGAAGSLDTELLAVHPYVRGETSSGLELWAIGGVGTGEAEDRSGQAGAAGETADLKMSMAAAGLRRPLARRGAFEFSLVGTAGFVSLATDGGDGLRAVEDLDASITQGRLAVEVSYGAEALSPYLRVGARGDGGDGVTGGGVEVVGGLRRSGKRLDFEAQARWLAAYSEDDYEEYGGMARVAFKSRPDGSGLRLALAPSWGAATGGALIGGTELLGRPNTGMTPPVGGAMHDTGTLSLQGELGYGFLLDAGLLTLGTTHERNATNLRESFGFTWETRTPETTDPAQIPDAGGALKLRLVYERTPNPTQSGPRFELTYTTRF